MELEFPRVDFFATGEFGAGFLEFFDPEQVGGELGDFATEVGVAEFLLVVMERGGQTTFGVIVHGVGADLEFDNLFFGGDDGGVNGLIAVLFGGGNVIFDTTVHGGEKGMNNAKGEITGGDVVNYEAQGDEVVNAVDVLVVFGEFFV